MSLFLSMSVVIGGSNSFASLAMFLAVVVLRDWISRSLSGISNRNVSRCVFLQRVSSFCGGDVVQGFKRCLRFEPHAPEKQRGVYHMKLAIDSKDLVWLPQKTREKRHPGHFSLLKFHRNGTSRRFEAWALPKQYTLSDISSLLGEPLTRSSGELRRDLTPNRLSKPF